MAIYEFEGKRPFIGKGSYIHPEASIIGDVHMGEGCYVGAGARIRGDWGSVKIGAYSNIQENCIIHAHPGGAAVLGERSHVGHGAILHTPNLGDHVLIGMGAIVMDFGSIGDGCCIAAGALVNEKVHIPPNKLAVGLPAKVVADISNEMRQRLEEGTDYYVALPARCLPELKEVSLGEVMGQ